MDEPVIPEKPTEIPSVGPIRTGVAALSGGKVILLLVITIICYAVFMGGATVGGQFLGQSARDDAEAFSILFLALLAIQPIVFVGVGYVVAIRLWGLTWIDFGLAYMRRKWFFIVPAIWLVCMPFVFGLKYLSDLLLGTPGENPYVDAVEALGSPTPGLIAAVIVLGGIIVPFSEEFVFRGLLYPWLKSRWGIVWAVVVSSVLFSLLHLHPSFLAPILLLGVVMALLREYSDSIWAPFLFHAINNTMVFAALFGFMAMGDNIRAV